MWLPHRPVLNQSKSDPNKITETPKRMSTRASKNQTKILNVDFNIEKYYNKMKYKYILESVKHSV